MQAINCENCGGSDFKRTATGYVCNYCNSIYRKSGLDMEDILLSARRAKDKEDWEDAERYYDLLELYAPTNIEAIFYSAYCKIRHCASNEKFAGIQNAYSVLNNSVDLLSENYIVCEENKELIGQMSGNILSLPKALYGEFTFLTSYITDYTTLNLTFCRAVNDIAEKYPEDDITRRFFYYIMLNHAVKIQSISQNPSQWNTMIENYCEKIRRFDPNFTYKIKREAPPAPKAANNTPAVMLGVCSLIFGILSLLLIMGEIPQCIVGVAFAIGAKSCAKKSLNLQRKNALGKAGNVLSTIGIILGIIFLALATVLSFI